MTDIRDRAVQAATAVTWTGDLSVGQATRRIQDAALGAVDPRALQRLAPVDRAFDHAVADLGRRTDAAVAAAPRVRRFSPLPELAGMLAAGFGGGLAVGAGRVVSRTPAGEMRLVGPSVLVLAVVALLLLLLGAAVAVRERATSTARALFLWFATAFAAVAAIGVGVRLAVEEFTGVGVAAVVAMAVVVVVAGVLAVGATRRRTADGDDFPARSRAGAAERNALLSASEDAQDGANEVVDALEEESRTAFLDAWAAGLDAAAERRTIAAGDVRRVRSATWAAARYDVSAR